MKPWREAITPHEDVLHGTFQESEFAADLTKVVKGIASPEYQDPELFFQRTVITEGMARLLESVLKRLSGNGGDPVMQLQTAFGGGKTHTMLAVLHATRGEKPANKLQGIPALLDATKIRSLPTGRIAVIDGNNLAPAQPQIVDGTEINTLWGHIAHQLGGEEGLELVKDSDVKGTSPGKDRLIQLFERYAPCVVLIDEAVAYLRQFEPGQSYTGGTYDSNLSFFQALTEAATAVPAVMVLGSLPESVMEVGDQLGKRALDSLEKYFGRLEAVWKPVDKTEAFEIVRRRLFKPVHDDAARDTVCRAFSDYYLANSQVFPAETRDASYLQQLTDTYPIHPEVFTRLYEDWSTLPKFQRTRGVLRLMARLIYRLWNDGNQDLLIMPGSFPLYDRDVRTELIKYLDGMSWDAIVERDIDGKSSAPSRLDDQTPALGQLQASRRAARTIFLGSAPSSSAQKVRGVGIERVRLGCAQPPQSAGRYDDAVRRLSDKLHYLYSGNDRYWYDTRPNLRREMEDRQQRYDALETYLPEIQSRLEKALTKSGFLDGIHVFRDHGDVPDDHHLRLVVIAPNHLHQARAGDSRAILRAKEVLEQRGNQVRQHQNRLLFCAADIDSFSQLRIHTRAYLAWDSIVRDSKQLNLDHYHQEQAAESRATADRRLQEALLQAFCWLIAPRQEISSDGGLLPQYWEEERLERGGRNLTDAVKTAAIDSEMVIPRWAPVHLKRVLDEFYFVNGKDEVETTQLWGDIARYTYLPRLRDPSALTATIEAGLKVKDFFGLVSGRDGDSYKGVLFGDGGGAYLVEGEVLITPDAAQKAVSDKPESTQHEYEDSGSTSSNVADSRDTPQDGSVPDTEVGASALKVTRFYAAAKLDPIGAKGQFRSIVDEVVQNFTAKYGTDVSIRVEIEATDKAGFEDQVQRTVRENCRTLGFDSAEFEE